MVNVGYHAARLQGRVNRTLFGAMLPLLVRRSVRQAHRVPISVYSFSCKRDVPEQAVCINSFLRHVGVPDRFVVISDGSHAAQDRHLLRQIAPCVEVMDWTEIIRSDLPACVMGYARQHPMGKKLASLISLPVEGPTVYVDADVIFFSQAAELRAWSLAADIGPMYLADNKPSLNMDLLNTAAETSNPVNSGLLLLNRRIDWQGAVDRLERLESAPDYFTEQTLVHLAMHNARARPLCPDRFVLATDDQFRYSEAYKNSRVALRHYVGPIRHRFWSRARNVWA